ncbi:MAG: SIMPL domain-containing protein, partial [Alistipes sp.]|nr:SIMPL domain-containing protein [Alistipes sp.]
MKQNLKYLIIGVAIIASAWLLGRAYTYKFRAQDTIVVTGLGETEFASDLIVWDGEIVYETLDVATGYAQLERNKQKVLDFITSRG